MIMPYCPLGNSYQPLEEGGGEYTLHCVYIKDQYVGTMYSHKDHSLNGQIANVLSLTHFPNMVRSKCLPSRVNRSWCNRHGCVGNCRVLGGSMSYMSACMCRRVCIKCLCFGDIKCSSVSGG